MKKIKIICCLLICFFMAGCKNSKLKKIEEKNDDYIKQIITLNKKVEEETEKNSELLTKLEKYEPEVIETGECVFIRSYRVVDIMNYQTTDNTSKFVILDQFQEFQPFVVNLTKDQAAALIKNNSYEFTFSGNRKHQKSEYNELFKNYELTNIKETDKVGLDQLQEPCL